jgi:uncharacterized protein (DUF697 family)
MSDVRIESPRINLLDKDFTSTRAISPVRVRASSPGSALYYLEHGLLQPYNETGVALFGKRSHLSRETNTSYFTGFALGLAGICRTLLFNKRVRAASKPLLSGQLRIASVLYSSLIVAIMLSLPFSASLSAIAPATVYLLALLVPLWMYNLTLRLFPVELAKMFLVKSRQLDEDLSAEFAVLIDQNAAKYQTTTLKAFNSIMSTSGLFSLIAVIIVITSLIPLIGFPIATIASLLLVSKSISWRIMDVYTIIITEMTKEEREEFMSKYERILLGFSIPATMIMSVPFVGPFALGFVQSAVAELYYTEMYKNEVEDKERAEQDALQSSPTSIV